jgi:RNA polymerase sigma-70 factor (ECF subfamily)
MTRNSEFIRLFMPVQGDLLAYILSMGVRPEDAEDVLQDSASVMFSKIEQFQSGTNFRAWAYAIVRNEILRYFSKTKKKPLSLSGEAYDDVEHLATDESEVPSIRLRALIMCLESLGSQARDMIMMRYRDNMQVKGIADELGRPANSVYVTLSRIRKKLQECIARAEVTEGETG